MKTKSLLTLPALLISSFIFMACPGSKSDEPEPEHTGAFSFSAANNDMRAPSEISFTPDVTLENASYIWDFGDGTTTTDPKPKKVFTTGGTKTVRLSVTANGSTKTETKTLTIDNPFTKVRIKKSTILSAATAYPDGTGWDVATSGTVYGTGGPDVYIIGRFSNVTSTTDRNYSTTIKTNSSATNLTNGTLFWEHAGSGILLSSSAATEPIFRIELRDADVDATFWKSTHERMGWINLKLSDLMTVDNKYPTSRELKGFVDNAISASDKYRNEALKLRFELAWEQ